MSLAKTTRPRTTLTVPRARLFRILDRAAKKPVTWVWAPPGSGKTTLVATYLTARKRPHLWFQIDDGDEDLASFFYFLGLAAPKRRRSLPLLSPEYRGALPTFARNFFREFYGRFKAPLTLVFDNYQEVSADAELNRIMPVALAELPETARAIFISRSEPPPTFAPLRAKQAVDLLDWSEIKFTRSEVIGLARRLAPGHWPKNRIDKLHHMVDGWAAGLVLLLDQSRRDGDTTIFGNASSAQVLFNYFASEIFQRMDGETKDVLLQTAFLERMTPAIAEGLTGSARSAEILAQLHRQNYFTNRRAGSEPRYEYHPLFREFLRAEARRVYTVEQQAEICRRAADILTSAGRIEGAASLYSEAQDWQGLAKLIRTAAPALVDQGRLQTVLEWLSHIPEPTLTDEPWLLYWRSICRQRQQFAASRSDAAAAIEGFRARQDPVGAYTAWASAVFSIIYESEDARQFDFWIALMDDLRREFPVFPSETIETHVACGMLVTVTWRQPRHRLARYWVERSHDLALRSRDRVLRAQIFSTLAINFVVRGEFGPLDAVEAELKKIARERYAPALAQLCAHVGLTWLWLAGRHEASLGAAKNVLETARTSGFINIVCGFQSHALMATLSHGDVNEAKYWLAKPFGPLENAGKAYAICYQIGVVWEALLRGEFARAADAVDPLLAICENTAWAFDEASAKLVALQALHETGRTSEALTLLARVLELADALDSPFVEFMARLAEAQIALDQRRGKDAIAALRGAFTLGRKEGYGTGYGWRPTVMARLCAKALDAGIEIGYVRDLIARRQLEPEESGTAENWPWPIKVYTLGNFTVHKNDRPLTFGHKVQRKPLALLKAIIAYGGENVQEETLLDLLWGDADGDAARIALNSAVHRLRKLLGRDDAILRQDNRLGLNGKICWVDALAIERLLYQAESRQPADEPSWAEAVRAVTRALALYHGPFLDDEITAAAALSDRLKRRLLTQLMRVGAQAERRDQRQDAANFYEQGFHIDPTAEAICRRLMNLYHQSGRAADALSIYHRCREALKQQLGGRPSPETEALFNKVRSFQLPAAPDPTKA